MRDLRDKFRTLKDRDEMALIAFIMAALPDEDLCLDCIKALEQRMRYIGTGSALYRSPGGW
ncbi:hypothetical protein [Syntrophomonas palmitatica]|uniref:hypothetical protein n=1 Tax=Syntrophomonas palmitatica TaxID=402877 RepID=UPI000AC6A5FA|nr:hypothetical protein [Syntrophomonas palmitatica]